MCGLDSRKLFVKLQRIPQSSNVTIAVVFESQGVFENNGLGARGNCYGCIDFVAQFVANQNPWSKSYVSFVRTTVSRHYVSTRPDACAACLGKSQL